MSAINRKPRVTDARRAKRGEQKQAKVAARSKKTQARRDSKATVAKVLTPQERANKQAAQAKAKKPRVTEASRAKRAEEKQAKAAEKAPRVTDARRANRAEAKQAKAGAKAQAKADKKAERKADREKRGGKAEQDHLYTADPNAKKRDEREAEKSAKDDHLYSGESRADKARGRAEQRAEDSQTARETGTTSNQVIAERDWQQGRKRAVQEAVRAVAVDTAPLAALPGGALVQQAQVAAAALKADAAYNVRTPRPILRDRAAPAMRARLAASFSRLEQALAEM